MINTIVFDLGGVLVHLDGQPINSEWLTGDHGKEQYWQTWLSSTTVQRFDRGEISVSEFAQKIIEEIPLNVTKSEFIEWFKLWPQDFFPGAFSLLSGLSEHYQLGIFSNITDLHWPKYYDQLKEHGAITYYFASYLMGLAKPDPVAFEFIVSEINQAPSSILFIDNNLVNVESAQSVGLQAIHASGLIQTGEKLVDAGLLSPSFLIELKCKDDRAAGY